VDDVDGDASGDVAATAQEPLQNVCRGIASASWMLGRPFGRRKAGNPSRMTRSLLLLLLSLLVDSRSCPGDASSSWLGDMFANDVAIFAPLEWLSRIV
jgi:hypothetical protein